MERRTRSLKWQMVGTMLACWLVPVLLVLGVMGWYISDNLGQQAVDNLTGQLSVNVRMCADRLDSAITSSRTASFDTTVKTSWAAYEAGTSPWPALYRASQSFLDRQYRNDSRFRFAALYFIEDPQTLRAGTFNPMLGLQYGVLRDFWDADLEAVAAEADGLGTGLAFLQRGEQLYLVRNVVDNAFRPIATLALALNPDYYFGELETLAWGSDVTVYLDGQTLALKGEPQPEPAAVEPADLRALGRDSRLTVGGENREYQLDAVVRVDTDALLTQFAGYRSILAVMMLLLIPMLIYALVFFDRKVSQPVQALMAGAGEIERGELGYQTDYRPNSREFQYLTDSFNHMSGQLRHQFDRLYQEEIALRDARIKALQSHINPHFLNNTLEIINWEARMNGDARVSKMIEALSTLMDAAVARDKRPEVLLREEMGYVNAYLYIIDQRFGQRLTVNLDMAPETLDCPVPRLILQPVIENAVEHGIGPGGRGGITVHSFLRDGLLYIDVENEGTLTAENEGHIRKLLAPDYDASRETSGNIGIANVNQRLRILYGEPSGLQIGVSHGKVVARITIKPKAAGADCHARLPTGSQ